MVSPNPHRHRRGWSCPRSSSPSHLGLGEFRVDPGRCDAFPPRLAPDPAGLEIAGQHVKQRQIPFRVGVGRIDRPDLKDGRDRLIQPAKLNQRQGLVDPRHDEAWLSARLVEPWQRFFVPTEHLQRSADIVADLGAARTERVRPPLIEQSFLESLQPPQHKAPLLEHQGMAGMQSVAAIKVGKRFLEPLKVTQDRSTPKHGVAVTRIERQHMTIGQQGHVRALQLEQSVGKAAPALDVVRLELYHLLKGLRRLFETSQPPQRDTQRGHVFHFGLSSDGAAEPFHRMIALAGFGRTPDPSERQHRRHQARSRGVSGRRPAPRSVARPGCGRDRPDRVRQVWPRQNHPGLSGLAELQEPTLATIHGRASK